MDEVRREDESLEDFLFRKFGGKKKEHDESGLTLTTCALIFKDGKILLSKRLSGFNSGSYGVPGGHVELGEGVLDGCVREIKEETGLNINKEDFEKVTFSENVYDDVHFVNMFYAVEITDDSELKNMEPDAHEDWQWFSIDDLPNPRFEDIDEMIEEYNK